MMAMKTPVQHGRDMLNTIIVYSVDQVLPIPAPVAGEKHVKPRVSGPARLPCGRNDPCPCGCGKKAKKCPKRTGAG